MTSLVKLDFFPAKFDIDGLLYKTDDQILYRNVGSYDTPAYENIASLVSVGLFGDGSDGNATDPAFPSVGVRQYNDLTFTTNTTWTATGYGILIIHVAGTLQIDSSVTWTINGTGMNTGGGGRSGGSSGPGGAASAAGFTVIIVAATITAGSGAKILVDETANGTAGQNGAGPGSVIQKGGDGYLGELSVCGAHVVADGGQAGAGGAQKGGTGGLKQTHGNAERLIHSIADLLHTHGGAGGGGGQAGSGSSLNSTSGGGGGGGAGGTAFHADGGNGGKGGDGGSPLGNGQGGAGAGGGGSALLTVITDSMDADCAMEVLAGNGGKGGDAVDTPHGHGGGGGGGAACNLLVAPSDPSNTRTETGGSGGAAGSGPGVAGVAGVVGGTADIFINIDDILRT